MIRIFIALALVFDVNGAALMTFATRTNTLYCRAMLGNARADCHESKCAVYTVKRVWKESTIHKQCDDEYLDQLSTEYTGILSRGDANLRFLASHNIPRDFRGMLASKGITTLYLNHESLETLKFILRLFASVPVFAQKIRLVGEEQLALTQIGEYVSEIPALANFAAAANEFSINTADTMTKRAAREFANAFLDAVQGISISDDSEKDKIMRITGALIFSLRPDDMFDRMAVNLDAK